MKTPTIEAAFASGVQKSKKRSEKNDATALRAVTRKSTPPVDRAYWTGYLCAIGDLSNF
jgi:hypothetical protein